MTRDGLALRSATSADLPALHALIESAYRGELAKAGWTHEADLIEGPRTSIAELQALIDDPAERLLLHEQDGAPIGSVQLSRRTAETAYLGLLTVSPTRQSEGLGKRIMAAAEGDAARHFGSRTIEMTVVSERPELIAFYKRRGYAPTGERRPFPIALDPPLEFVVLAKAL